MARPHTIPDPGAHQPRHTDPRPNSAPYADCHRNGHLRDGIGSGVLHRIIRRLSDARHVIEEISADEACELGAKAAEVVVASARWSRLVGDRIDTSEASRVLGISRQALSKRQASGSLLGLPGHNTTWYPTWQLDIENESIRPEVRDIVGAFRDALGEGADPFLIASWASTTQHEDLNGSSPPEWLADGKDIEQLRQAAQRAAERSAQ